MHLLDVNVWLALAVDGHMHHAAAARWFLAAPVESCCFCRVTQQGFLRLLTTPQVLGEHRLTLLAAWRVYDDLCNDARVVYAEEPAGLEAIWRANTQDQAYSPKVWNDAYLAAFADAAGFGVVTFDRGFERYLGMMVEVLG